MTTSHRWGAIDHFKMLSSIVVAQNLAGQVAHHGRCKGGQCPPICIYLCDGSPSSTKGSSQGLAQCRSEDALVLKVETASSPIARA